MKETNGNLVEMALDGDFDVIIHGCNCFNAMASGIAREIAMKIPEAKMADNMYVEADEFDKLSNFSYAPFRNRIGKIGIVINLYTQYQPGKDLRMEALVLGFKKLSRKILTMGDDVRIGIPLIGCGIAGGNWELVGPLLEKIMSAHNITVVHFNNGTNKVQTDK